MEVSKNNQTYSYYSRELISTSKPQYLALISYQNSAANIAISSILFVLFFTSFYAIAKPTTHSLEPFNAEYVAFRSGNDVGSTQLNLTTLDSERFELTYRSKLSRFFLSDKRYEKTIFTTNNGQLVPISYEYKRTGTGSNKSLSLSFNQETALVRLNDDQAIQWSGEFDNQLFRIDLPHKLANGLTEMSYHFINYRGEKRRYEMTVINSEYLELPYGRLEAIKVQIARESNSRVTFAWFAPSLNHNLVRLQQFKDKKEQGDMKLKRFTYL